MDRNDVRGRLDAAILILIADHEYLLIHDLGEWCIASRLPSRDPGLYRLQDWAR
jgi:hypothetical protein